MRESSDLRGLSVKSQFGWAYLTEIRNPVQTKFATDSAHPVGDGGSTTQPAAATELLSSRARKEAETQKHMFPCPPFSCSSPANRKLKDRKMFDIRGVFQPAENGYGRGSKMRTEQQIDE